MKITFNAQSVCQQLTCAASIVNAKNVIPILDNFFISISGNNAIVTTSDGDIWLTVLTELKSDADFKFSINANKLTQALRNLSDNDVVCELENDIATFYYNGGYFKLPYTNDDCPVPPNKTNISEDNKITIPQINLKNALLNVDYAVSYDPLRLVLNGVHFDFFEDKSVVVACDSNKLAKHTDKDILSTNGFFSFTLPLKTVNLLKTLLPSSDNIEIKYNDTFVVFTCNEFKLTARLIEGRYPNYESVIPKENDIFVNIAKTELINAIRRVAQMGNSGTELIKFEVNKNNLVVFAENDELSTSGKEKVDCESNADKFIIGFKSSVVLDVFKNIDADKITIEMSKPDKACVAHYGDKDKFLALLMPMVI